MANQDFVEIISDKAIGNIAAANVELGKLLQTLNVTVTTANKLNLSSGSGSKPSQSNTNTASNNAAIERNIKAIERQRLAELKLAQDREKAFSKYDAALSKENAKLVAASSLYNKVQQKLNQLNKEYRELAVQKELTSKLTDSEAKRYDFLNTRITKYDTILKGVDASMGKHQRNVGNYASGFSPLSNSINQLSRELPALAVNTQTFFLAISNNLPAVFDAYKTIIAQNKALVAQGKETQSFAKQFASSLFSVGTALSIGITLLTFFGDDLVKLAGDLFKGSKAIDSIKESTKQLDEVRVSGLKSITQERLELQNNLAIAKDTTLSYKEREIAAQNVLDQYPYWFESLGKEAILNGNVEKAVRGVNDALLARALAEAAVSKITENQSKIIDLNEQALKLTQQLDVAEKNYQANRKNRAVISGGASTLGGGTYDVALAAAQRVGDVQRQIANNQKEINSLQEINNRLADYALTNSKTAIGLDYESAKVAKEKQETQLQAETNSRVAFERNIAILEEELSLISQDNAAYGILSGQLKLVKGAYEALYGAQKDNNDETEKTIKYGTAEYYQDVINKLSKERDQLADTTEQYELYNQMIARSQEQLDKLTGKKEDVKKLTDEVQKYLNSFSEGFLNDAKLGSFNMFLSLDENGENPIDKLLKQTAEGAEGMKQRFAIVFNSIAESAQEAFAFIQQNQQAAFDSMYANLDREKDARLMYVGDNEAARAEIEKQYEDRRREVRRKELQAQKEQAMFNIAINTAQGITAALASVPPNVPLSIVIGAIGAAQLALVASRQIPAYKMGTDNHGGGLAIVGDGNKHEVVHQPTLGWSITPSKSTLVNLEKGSKVFPDLASSGVFNSDLPDMIQLNGSGITVGQMDRIMQQYHAKQVPHIHIDKSGIRAFTRGELSRTEKLDNIVRFNGRKK